MHAVSTFLGVLLAAQASALQPGTDSLSIIPRPVSVTMAKGAFTLNSATAIWSDRAFASVARQFARDLEPATGFTFRVQSGRSGDVNRVAFQRDPALAKTLGSEGYKLDIRASRVVITASGPAGAFYGAQTVRQLLSPAILRAAAVAGAHWTIPATTIVDYPRFTWRGAHLDVARHFMPKEFVKKYIDLLALHKMNVFHWHLTDDQGWRLEIKKYPRLTSVGAWRAQTIVGHPARDSTQDVYDHKPAGGFYTQDDAREIVAYAKDRFVTVVPEIEMPGHSQAAIAAYPMLGNFGDTVPVWTRWGVTQHILNPSDTTIQFMQDVLTEVMSIFPGPFIHTGGDEAPKTEWKASPRAQAKMRELGDTSEDQLQSWFTKQMDTFLTSKGRRLVGWDEILEGGLAPNAVVMSWRGIQGGITAARADHDVVMAPGSYTYFDHYQSLAQDSEPLAIGGFLPIDSVYAYDPVPTELEPQYVKHILGAQAQVWTEYIPDPKQAEYMAFPRMAAMAEVDWTPVARKDFADFQRRLASDLERLANLDVNYRDRWPIHPGVVRNP